MSFCGILGTYYQTFALEQNLISLKMRGLSNTLKVMIPAQLFRSMLIIINAFFATLFILNTAVKPQLVIVLDFLFFTLAYYLAACDPLPPGQEKLWDKIKKLFVTPKENAVHS